MSTTLSLGNVGLGPLSSAWGLDTVCAGAVRWFHATRVVELPSSCKRYAGVSGCQSGFGEEGDGAIQHITCSWTGAERGQGEQHLHRPARGEPGGAVVVPQPQFLWLRWSTRGGPPIPDPSPREDSVFWAVLTFPGGQPRCPQCVGPWWLMEVP